MKKVIEEIVTNEVEVSLPYYSVSGDLFYCIHSEMSCTQICAGKGYERIGWTAPENALTMLCTEISKNIFEKEFEIVLTIIKNKIYAR